MPFADWIIRRVTRRPPDIIIGPKEQPYLRRWHVIPRNRFFNIYLHHFLASDDDRALHDHPWVNLSILLKGCYWEHTDGSSIFMTGIVRRDQGDWVFRRSGKISHRIELDQKMIFDGLYKYKIVDMPVWTLFITGPRYRMWGFHCPNGWKPFHEFLARYDGTDRGKGCDE